MQVHQEQVQEHAFLSGEQPGPAAGGELEGFELSAELLAAGVEEGVHGVVV